MGLLMDIVLVAILVLNVIIGYKKGLINVIFNICAFLLAIVITIILYKPVSNIIIENTNIKENIKSTIINNNPNEATKEEKTNTNDIQKYIENTVQGVADDAKEKATETVAETIAIKVVEIITCIILFILTRIILILLKFVTETISNLPLIKQFNEIGGLVYGVVKGLIIIYILLTILFLVVSINGNGAIANSIEESNITKFLYNNNIIVNYCLLGKNLL